MHPVVDVIIIIIVIINATYMAQIRVNAANAPSSSAFIAQTTQRYNATHSDITK